MLISVDIWKSTYGYAIDSRLRDFLLEGKVKARRKSTTICEREVVFMESVYMPFFPRQYNTDSQYRQARIKFGPEKQSSQILKFEVRSASAT